jgi:RNA polymerase sigma-70 factor (ECF subfamily)
MLFHDSRRRASVGARGELVLLEDQDRALWERAEIEEGRRLLKRALALRNAGPYQLQAAIAELHTQGTTDWEQVALLYERLLDLAPSPVVELNRAVAVAFAHGPARGLELIDEIAGLGDYHLFHAARADLLRRLGSTAAAADSYRAALSLATNEAERRFLAGRLREVGAEA